jgi:hypothetical protein
LGQPCRGQLFVDRSGHGFRRVECRVDASLVGD